MDKEKALTIWLPVIADGVKDLPECKEALEMAIKALENQKTGKWIGDWFSPKCSVCGKKPLYERYYGVDGEETSLLKSSYCPYCGAKMEGE